MSLSHLASLPPQTKKVKLHLLRTSVNISSRLAALKTKDWTPFRTDVMNSMSKKAKTHG